MHSNYPRALALLVALSVSTAVFATDRPLPPNKQPPAAVAPPVTVSADPSARSSSAARAGARSNARARARADSASTSSAEQAQSLENVVDVGGSSSGGNVLSTATDMLALDIPGHAAATAVDGCHVSRGSLGFLGAGSGGRIKFDEDCAAHARCLENVVLLRDLGQRALAVEAAAKCAGVTIPAGYVLEPVPPAVPVTTSGPDPRYVTQEQLRRAFEASQGKGEE